jgi:hypothetical protein
MPANKRRGGLGKIFWATVNQIWLVLFFVTSLGLLAFSRSANSARGRALFGRRRCPECAVEYDAPMFAVNFGATRYERCPLCRHWHWTKAFSQTGARARAA